MMSMTGQTTLVLSSAILARRGSSQPLVHSQWASRNVSTFPLACAAPSSRALMSPVRLCALTTLVGTGSLETYSSSGAFRKVRSLASSTSSISRRRWRGERLMAECTVLSRVDQASL
uniref:Putative secreted protein n=1 Tax=Ixodes ricinus TaxID=34613 RepID=A0A6B0ULI0_IXORI